MDKRIIINADDFGLTSAVNYGILDAYLRKAISSISLMINAPRSREAIELIKKYNIDCVGIHVNVTLGKPVSHISNIPSLIEENGNFHKSQWWFENKANEQELIQEFDAQIKLFEELVGHKPQHINYHHRYDFYQNYPILAKHLYRTYQLPMRLEKDDQEYVYEYAYNSTYFLTKGKLEDELHYPLIEMPCHVGYVDKELMEISSLNLERMNDYDLVCSSEFQAQYQQAGYKLIGFDQVKRKRI